MKCNSSTFVYGTLITGNYPFGFLGNHGVTIPYNMTVTINCTEKSIIKILNITVKENSRCKPKRCELLEEQELNIKKLCDGEKTCNVTSNIPNSCLNDFGFLNYSYTCTGKNKEYKNIPNYSQYPKISKSFFVIKHISKSMFF